MRGGTPRDLLVDEVEVGELPRGGAGALLAGGGLLLLGQKITSGEPRLLFLILGAGAGCRRRAGASRGHTCIRVRRRRETTERRAAGFTLVGGLMFPAQFHLFAGDGYMGWAFI